MAYTQQVSCVCPLCLKGHCNYRSGLHPCLVCDKQEGWTAIDATGYSEKDRAWAALDSAWDTYSRAADAYLADGGRGPAHDGPQLLDRLVKIHNEYTAAAEQYWRTLEREQ